MEEREDREDYTKFLEKENKGEKFGTLGDILKSVNLNK